MGLDRKINFFDLGVHKGVVTKKFADICGELGLKNFNVYGFEARRIYYEWYKRVTRVYGEKVNCYHYAISDRDGMTKLYYSKNGIGDSIFETKNDKILPASGDAGGFKVPGFLYFHADLLSNYIYSMGGTLTSYNLSFYEKFNSIYCTDTKAEPTHSPAEYEDVHGILFSRWLKNNVLDLANSINILKLNIEGAELYLFQDLIDSGLLKHFNIICGAGHDIEKVPELSDNIVEYENIIKENNIKIHRFSDWHPEKNADMRRLIKELL